MGDAFWAEVGHLLLVLGGIGVLWVQGRLLGRETRQIHNLVNSQRDDLLAEIARLEKVIREKASTPPDDAGKRG